MPKTFTEPSRKIKVWRECDVVVVGGGPGGIGSAIAAARGGAKTILIERYGHLGGMATGGLVNIIPNLSDMSGKQHIFGLVQEMLDRLEKRGGATWPPKEHWGTTDRKIVDYYLDVNLGWFYVRNDANRGKECALYTAVVDPEILKDEFNDMVLESGAEMLLHSWGVEPIMEGNTAKGVIFESKSGRQAILAKVVIDSTGDGDMFVRAGAEFDGTLDNKHRDAWLALNWWVTNVDIRKWSDFRTLHAGKYAEMMDELTKLGGYTRPYKGILKNQPNTVWYHCMQPQAQSTDAMDVEQLSRIDIRARKRTMITFDFMKKNVPGFENSFIMQVAPQLGTQGGRRVIGEYTLTEKDMTSGEIFEDTIAVLANNDHKEVSAGHPALCIPYRCLVPKKIDGLLVACRGFSSEDLVNNAFNIIPHCMCYGQGAGTGAALAIKAGVEPRKVNYKALHDALVKQGVGLPEGKKKELKTQKSKVKTTG